MEHHSGGSQYEFGLHGHTPRQTGAGCSSTQVSSWRCRDINWPAEALPAVKCQGQDLDLSSLAPEPSGMKPVHLPQHLQDHRAENESQYTVYFTHIRERSNKKWGKSNNKERERGKSKRGDKKQMISYDNTGLSKSPGFPWALEKWQTFSWGISNEVVCLRYDLSREWQ